MRKKVMTLVSHPLISGSSIIFAGSFVINILNYVFNLIMGRMLSISDYGLLISLVALVSLLMLFQNSLTTLFAKFASMYSARNDRHASAALVRVGTKVTLVIGSIFLFILILLLYPISMFLHVNNYLLLVVMFLSVFFSILTSLPNGILQGNLKFVFFSFVSTLNPLTKITIGVLLVFLGFGVLGAATGMLIAVIIPFTVAYIYVYKKNNKISKNDIHMNFMPEFKKISGPFLIASVTVTILQGTDVIFARHFLSEVQAGQFAALSLMGKAIFYLTAPIYFVFFPLISHKKEKKEDTYGTLLLATGIVILCSSIFTFIYFTFPNIILHIFFPSPAYKAVAGYLGYYSVFILIFSICFLLYNYFLSLGRTEIYKITSFVAILYIVLLYSFHNTIFEMISILIVCSFLLLFSLLVYYIKLIQLK